MGIHSGRHGMAARARIPAASAWGAAGAALLCALALLGCGKAEERQTRPTDDEVRAALKAYAYSHVPKGATVKRDQPDFSTIKVLECTKSAKEGFECEFVNLLGARVRTRFAKGPNGWEAIERVDG